MGNHLVRARASLRQRRETTDNGKISERKSMGVFEAKFAYQGRSDHDLTFARGDLLEVLDANENWWLARHTKTHAEGLIPSNYVQPYESIEAEDWFFGPIRRVEAERYLALPMNRPGCFLIRESESQPGSYSLSVRDSTNQAKHYRIRTFDDGGGYFVQKTIGFQSVRELVAHYRETNGLCARLGAACVNPITPTTGPDPQWEIPRDRVQHVKALGRGQFGEVFEGLWNGVPVAVKTLREGQMNREEFMREADVMKQLRHPKLVQLFGVCTIGEPVYIIMELMSRGALLEFLRVGEGRNLNTEQLIDIGAQVACGMAYLESQNFIHRDLAARNVLVDDFTMCKITDFGMARFAPDDFYEAREGAKFPIKWTAPEAAIYQMFTTKSDVWSFGILLVELVTRGAMPYAAMSGSEVLSALQEGYRMPTPRNCPDRLYQVMMTCWHDDPQARPTFETLQWTLEDFFVSNVGDYREA